MICDYFRAVIACSSVVFSDIPVLAGHEAVDYLVSVHCLKSVILVLITFHSYAISHFDVKGSPMRRRLLSS